MSDHIHPLSAAIRARTADWVDAALSPQAYRDAIISILDHCDGLMTDIEGNPSRVGYAMASGILRPMAKAFDIEEDQ